MNPSLVHIPVVGLSFKFGYQLALEQNPIIQLDLQTENITVESVNVLAETGKVNDSVAAIVVGGHLDGSTESTGIEDNGSGVAAVLELASALHNSKALDSPNKIIFALWGAEEVWLYGSFYYIQHLGEHSYSVEAYLNHDMVAAPNYVTAIFNASALEDKTLRDSCSKLQSLYTDYYTSIDITPVLVPYEANSDYAGFLEELIPAAAPLSEGGGPDLIKTDEEFNTFGGVSNVDYDPCYHEYCDTLDNYSPVALERHTKASAYVLQKLALQDDLHGFLKH